MAMSEVDLRKVREKLKQPDERQKLTRAYQAAVVKLVEAGLGRKLEANELESYTLVCVLANSSEPELVTFLFGANRIDNQMLQVWRRNDRTWMSYWVEERYVHGDGSTVSVLIDSAELGYDLGAHHIEVRLGDHSGMRFEDFVYGVPVRMTMDKMEDSVDDGKEFMERVVNYTKGNSLF